jgi:hypothetical protein
MGMSPRSLSRLPGRGEPRESAVHVTALFLLGLLRPSRVYELG